VNVTRYRQLDKEICIFTGTSGKYDAGIYGAPITRTLTVQEGDDLPTQTPNSDPARSPRHKPSPALPAVVVRLCLYTLREATLTELSGFLNDHGLFLPSPVEDSLWHQDVHQRARRRGDEDPLAQLTDWGDQSSRT